MNPTEISDALDAIAARSFDAATFGGAFAEATDNPRATVSKLRSGSINKSDLPGGMLHNRKFHFAPAEPGAVAQTLDALRASRRTATHKPAILIATDGETVSAEHRASGDAIHFPWAELGDHFGFLLPAAGKERYRPAEENPVDVKAAGKLARLYDALLRSDPAWKGPERRHAMNQFMTRLIFCLFAEDVGVFAESQFSAAVFTYGGDRGEHARDTLIAAFSAMNAPSDARDGLPVWARALPYVNGGLFAGDIDAPAFDAIAFRYLRDLSDLNWGEINPDIFGSMIQSVADPDARAELGMHYTSVPNIMKALGPLFLDELDAAIEKAWDRPKGLQRVLDRMARMRIFDPACGSGNFLVVAYRELRAREARILARIHALTGQTAAGWSAISLGQFHGIELDDFAAETAKLALFIAEAQANARHAGAFGAEPAKLPLKSGAKIVCGNALRLDWEQVCPPPSSAIVESDMLGPTGRLALDDPYEVFIAGNPPFLGKRQQTPEIKADMDLVFSGRLRTYRALDMVTCWFLRAADYIRGRTARAALVATNSVCQGASASTLWPAILQGGVEIAFAHRTFKWRNNAADIAGVMCVVVGLANAPLRARRLFDGDVEHQASTINAYLLDAAHVPVTAASRPLNGLPEMDFGNMPYDAGGLILSPEERAKVEADDPRIKKFLRRFLGSRELVQGSERHCLWIDDADLTEAKNIPFIAERLERTRRARLSMKDEYGRALAERPHQFREHMAPKQSAILVPSITSERRPYLPVAVVGTDVIPSNKNFAIFDGPMWSVALIASRMHWVWADTVCGKLKSDFQYSNTLGWNTFPVPDFTESQLGRLEASARAILRTRYEHHPKTIAELYDPDRMPDDLRAVHRANDELLEGMYVGRPFRSDAERLEHLFKLYAAKIASREAA